MALDAKVQEQLQKFLDAGAGMDDLDDELERLGLFDDQTAAPDDEGALRLYVEAPTSDREYFNLRDKAKGDPQEARALAEWVLRKRAAARDARVDAQAAFDRNLAQMKLWLKKFEKEQERTDAWAETVLAEYMTDFHAGEKKLPMIAAEALRWTKERDHIQWDEPAALEWALEQECVDEIAPRVLSKSKTKAVLEKRGREYYDTESGERVDFVVDVAPERANRFEIVDGKEA